MLKAASNPSELPVTHQQVVAACFLGLPVLGASPFQGRSHLYRSQTIQSFPASPTYIPKLLLQASEALVHLWSHLLLLNPDLLAVPPTQVQAAAGPWYLLCPLTFLPNTHAASSVTSPTSVLKSHLFKENFLSTPSKITPQALFPPPLCFSSSLHLLHYTQIK